MILPLWTRVKCLLTNITFNSAEVHLALTKHKTLSKHKDRIPILRNG